MRERPILFSGPMVRAILDDRKRQTRRVVKPQPVWCPRPPNAQWDGDGYWQYGSPRAQCLTDRGDLWSVVFDADYRRLACTGEAYGWGAGAGCPYGVAGDRLWVRESWRRSAGASGEVFYRADVSDYDAAEKGPWRPSIHMPRWASRLALDVTGVRVERLHDISEEDAIAEGIAPLPGNGPNRWTINVDGGSLNAPTAREVFAMLWWAINGRESWDANPWVWVVEFRRVEQEARAA